MILGPNGKPIYSEEEQKLTEDHLDSSREEYIAELKKEGKDVIMFIGGPYDGKVYSGTILPKVGHYGCWDDEVSRLEGSVMQMVRHVYKVAVVKDKLCWLFERSEDGPMHIDKPKPVPPRFKKPKK